MYTFRFIFGLLKKSTRTSPVNAMLCFKGMLIVCIPFRTSTISELNIFFLDSVITQCKSKIQKIVCNHIVDLIFSLNNLHHSYILDLHER